MSQENLLKAIVDERIRQEELKLKGKFYWTCADKRGEAAQTLSEQAMIDACRFAVLAEEFGEVSRHINEQIISNIRYQPRELMKELIQTAAVALAWCEAIESEDL